MRGWLVEMSISWEQRGGGGGSNKVFFFALGPRVSKTYARYMAGFFGSKYL